MWLSKEHCMSSVKRPQLRYLLANTTSGALLFDQVVWSAPASIFLFENDSWRKLGKHTLSYSRLLTFRATQKRNWTFFLRVISTRKRSVERKAPKLDEDRSWWLINLLADTAGLDLYLNTDVFIFLFCISVLLSAEGTRLYIWPEYCGASFTSTFTAGL